MEISMELTSENFSKNIFIWDDQKLRELFINELHSFFQLYIKQNRTFSRDDFQREGAYNVYFVPTSQSYNMWGQYVTVINVPVEYAEEVIGFNMNQDANINLVKKYAIIHREEESREIVTFDVREVYQIEHM